MGGWSPLSPVGGARPAQAQVWPPRPGRPQALLPSTLPQTQPVATPTLPVGGPSPGSWALASVGWHLESRPLFLPLKFLPAVRARGPARQPIDRRGCLEDPGGQGAPRTRHGGDPRPSLPPGPPFFLCKTQDVPLTRRFTSPPSIAEVGGRGEGDGHVLKVSMPVTSLTSRFHPRPEGPGHLPLSYPFPPKWGGPAFPGVPQPPWERA